MNDSLDSVYMQRAVVLALKGKGSTSPNPLVGAVIVKNGKIVGQGFHPQAGKPHAEIYALRQAGPKAKGATLFVNLEPCGHYGKTPPCTNAIIKHQIKKVIIGTKDPNPLVAGKGIKALRKAGIKVETGLLKEQCQEINSIFLKYIRTGLPYVILKAGMSLDGKIATKTGESKWITGDTSRRAVQGLRREVDAVMVGVGTVIKDDPNLNLRLKTKKVLKRIIVDSLLRIPLNKNIFLHSPELTIMATTPRASKQKIAQIKKTGAEVLVIPEKKGQIDLEILMQELGQRGLSSILLEGGAELNASAIRERIVDKVIFFIAPIIIGGKDSIPVIGGKGIEKLSQAFQIKEMRVKKIGHDLMVEGML